MSDRIAAVLIPGLGKHMDDSYITGLSREERAAWGFQVFIRLWLSGMCQSQAAQNWTISQIAILFEVTQGHLFREEAHTATSLSNELNLPIRYESWSWPTEPGGKPLLEEEYTYTKLRVNVGLTEAGMGPKGMAAYG